MGKLVHYGEVVLVQEMTIQAGGFGTRDFRNPYGIAEIIKDIRKITIDYPIIISDDAIEYIAKFWSVNNVKLSGVKLDSPEWYSKLIYVDGSSKYDLRLDWFNGMNIKSLDLEGLMRKLQDLRSDGVHYPVMIADETLLALCE